MVRSEDEVGEARRKPRTRAVGYLAVCRTSFLYANGETFAEEMFDMMTSRHLQSIDDGVSG